MALAINDTAPDFEAQTTEGKIKFHDWIGDKWAVLFSHPKDFTPVIPENSIRLGWRDEIESAHHRSRCLPYFISSVFLSPTGSSRGVGLKSRTCSCGISSIFR